jgi:hypothetical protein
MLPMTVLTLYAMIRVIAVNKHLLLLIISAITTLASIPSWALDFPEPPRSTVTGVSDSSTTYGITMAIRRFESRLNKDQIIEFYSNHWKDTAAVTLFEPWEMIGKVESKKFINVQVQNGFSGSWGYLTISDLPTAIEKGKVQAPSGAGFPSMLGSQVLSDQTHNDPTKTGRTLVINNNFSVNSNGQFYRNHYQGQGWQIIADSKGTRLKGAAITFAKGRQLLSMTINQVKSTTSVVANIETAKIFSGL